jgi:DNA adenine methylase
LQQEHHYRPLLRWAGSKRRLLNRLHAAAPQSFSRYVEPFCGSICFYLSLNPASALLSDNNAELIHFYKRIRHQPRAVGEMALSMPSTSDFYYSLRKLVPDVLSANHRAARFLYLNRHCFNGVYRTNRTGAFNVPRGKHMGAIPGIEEIVKFGRLIRNADFCASDFETIVEGTGEGDFVYLDPPYAGASRDRGEYGVNAFKTADLDRLAHVCENASRRGVKVLLSYADLPELIEKMPSWRVERFGVLRSVSGFTRGRGEANEILMFNY